MIVVPLISFFGFCLSYSLCFKKPIEESPIYVTSLFILSLYIAAYFGILSLSATLLLYLGGCAFVVSIVYLYREKVFIDVVSPLFLTWLVFFIIVSLLVSTRQFFAWDEFMHWGPHAKLTYLNNGFVTAANTVNHKSYPPGAALFYYFFYSICGYSEGVTYVSHLLLMTSAWMLPLKALSWKYFRQSIFSYLGFIVLLCAIYKGVIDNFAMIDLDVVVASFFGAILVRYYFSRQSHKDILLLIPLCCAFVLLKPQLIPFVALIAVLVLVSMIVRSEFSFARIFSLFLLLSLTAITCQSWKTYLASINLIPSWDFSSLAANFHLSLDWVRVQGFFESAQYQFSVFVVLSMTILFMGSQVKYAEKKTWLSWGGVLGLGFLAYTVMIFLFVMYWQVVYNGVTTYQYQYFLSVPRYLAVYLIGVVFWVYRRSFEFDSNSVTQPIKKSVLVFSSFLVIIICISYCLSYFQLYKKGMTVQQERAVLHEMAERVKNYTQPSDLFFTAWEALTPIQYHILNYELIPRKFKISAFKFGEPPIGKEAYFMNYSPLQLRQFLSQFDVVFLAYTNDAFWENYASVLGNVKQEPIMEYAHCDLTNNDERCEWKGKKAYLFKVVNKNGQTHFQSVQEGLR